MRVVRELLKVPQNVVFRFSSRTTSGVGDYDVTRSWTSDAYTSHYAEIWRVDPFDKHRLGPFQRVVFPTVSLPISHDFKYVFGSTANPKGRYSIKVDGWLRGYTVVNCRWLLHSEQHRGELINNAIKGALEEQANVALFLGELGKSADLLSDTAQQIARAVASVRKGKFSRAARELGIVRPKGMHQSKAFADNWLKLSYGWGPLIADTVGIMKHIHRGSRLLNIESKSRIESTIPMKASSRGVSQGSEGTNLHHLLYDFDYTGKWVRREQVLLRFRPNSNFWDQASRLGFTNPGQLFWESVPLSFVVGWFINLGDWLGNLNRGLTLDFLEGSYTEFHRNHGTVSATGHWANRSNSFNYYEGYQAPSLSAPFEQIMIKRETIPESEVTVSIVLDAPLSVNKAITAVALVVQRLH